MTDKRITTYIMNNYAEYDMNAENLELATEIFRDGFNEGKKGRIFEYEKQISELKTELEKMKKHSLDIQKICFDSCL